MPRLLFIAVLCVPLPSAHGQEPNEATERAIKSAVTSVAPMVVRIETAGGRGVAGDAGVRRGSGPTTGLVVSPDGYVVTSSFNFADNPSDIFVTVPGRPRLVAKRVASDTARMLTLLKVEASGLTVPAAVPKAEIKVGQWAAALGRTLDPDTARPPSVSVGIVGALGRVWGRAVQTDAKVSPVNYGGPLVAVDGRVFGVLVPLSPDATGDTAGVEWYDSGIGFAVPLEDVFAALPRLKTGKDLHPGRLGFAPEKPDAEYNVPVTVGTVAPDGPLAKAGAKTGDVLTAIDGHPVAHLSQLHHLLGPRYEGDTVSVTVRRDGKEQTFDKLTLAGDSPAARPRFLGVLPLRDDPEPGVQVRAVVPDSPAAKAGVKAGDRILLIGPATTTPDAPKAKAGPPLTRDRLAAIIARVPAGQSVRLTVKRKDGGKTESMTVALADPPEKPIADAPLPSSRKGAKPPAAPAEKKPKPETGLLRRTNPTLGREYWVYVPDNYDPKVSQGLLVWLHPAGRGGRDANDVVKAWKEYCAERHLILAGPVSKSPEGWLASEAEEALTDIRRLADEYQIDPRRVVAHGLGTGGPMAYYLGFAARDFVRGVAVGGAPLTTQPRDPDLTRPLAFFLAAGKKDPRLANIEEGKRKLAEKGFPVFYREMPAAGPSELDAATVEALKVWLDTLDAI
ncbi:MAG: PDZ domain-containing protein [Gemmataceae bacterium]